MHVNHSTGAWVYFTWGFAMSPNPMHQKPPDLSKEISRCFMKVHSAASARVILRHEQCCIDWLNTAIASLRPCECVQMFRIRYQATHCARVLDPNDQYNDL